jgi:hypothetical protein
MLVAKGGLSVLASDTQAVGPLGQRSWVLAGRL